MKVVMMCLDVVMVREESEGEGDQGKRSVKEGNQWEKSVKEGDQG